MADQFPCPNPTCSHIFTLAAVQAAATVQCPRCGFRMQGRGATAAPAKPRKAPAAAKKSVPPAPPKPAAPKPLPARPIMPAPTIDVDLVDVAPVPPQPAITTRPILPFPAVSAADPGPSRPVRRRADGLRLAIRAAVVLGVIVVACGVGGYLAVKYLPVDGDFLSSDVRLSDYEVINGRARNFKGTDETAFRLLLPKNAWTADKELRVHLAALGAWVNKQEDVWLAIAVKDYGMQKPREAELVQLGIERLENRFGDGLELEAKTEPVDFVGPPAQRLRFKGRLGTVQWWGECIMFSYHGFGYWVFLAGPSWDDLDSFEAALRQEGAGLTLVTDRKGWREQPPRTETFAGSDGALRITTPEGVWEQSKPANVEYETGTLLLLGRYQKEKDNQKNAHLQAFKLDGKPGDLKAAVQQARDYLEKVKKEQNTGYKLTPIAAAGKSELGEVQDIGNRAGRVAEMMLSLNDTPARYYLVAVINEADHTLVILCDCLWKSRQIWRQDFLQVLKTVRVQGKA